LLSLPIERRRELLGSTLPAPEDALRLSPLLRGPSRQVLEAVRKLGKASWASGLILPTSLASDQVPGSNSARTWSRSSSSAVSFGAHAFDALLVGVCEKKWRIFAAKVKNGFVPRLRDELFLVLKALQTAQCPFENLPEKRASRWGESLTAEKMQQCRWVKTKLVCQLAFVEWTDARHLRHCTFIGMPMTRSHRRCFAKLEPPGFRSCGEPGGSACDSGRWR
jgi:ATP dependent DNA ligase C terminal region